MQVPDTKYLLNKITRTLSEMLIDPSARILVGVSGGPDSMLLATVLYKLGYSIEVSHINFQLRGPASDADEELVRNWCEANKIVFHPLQSNTLSYMKETGLNIQSAAREIRYKWWDELMVKEQYDYVATAHHRDDCIESFFMNVIRGTGLKGLQGIPAKRDQYIRPFIEISKADVELLIAEWNIPFRTDASNERDEYFRNKIRHHLIPYMKEFSQGEDLLPGHSLERIRMEWAAWENAFDRWKNENVRSSNNKFFFTVHPENRPFALRWLEEKNIPWSLAKDYLFSNDTHGHVLQHGNWTLSRMNEGFCLSESNKYVRVYISSPGTYHVGPGQIIIQEVLAIEFERSSVPSIEYVSANSIQWPLEVRSIDEGDHFQPLGMQGHTKKLQDFLVDVKLDFHEKRETLLLTSNDQIVWVIGLRLDERFKVKSDNEKIYRLQYYPMPPERGT